MSVFLFQLPAQADEGNILDLFPRVTPPTRKQLLAKPMRPERVGVFFEAMLKEMLENGASWARFHGEIKYDGHSVTIAVLPDGRYLVQNRTSKERGEIEARPNAGPCFTPLAREMQVKFMAEKCALVDGKEAGFLEVPAAEKLFVENGMRNKPPCRFMYRIFGVVSISPGGLERTGEDLTLTQTRRLLDRLVVPGNGLFEPAELVAFRACLHTQDTLRFERQLGPAAWRTVALSAPEFREYMLAEADRLECEGFVLKKGRGAPAASLVKANTDSYGIFRDPSAVKLKREFDIHVVACLVVNGLEDRIKQRMVWLYARQELWSVYADGPLACERLSFAGDATDHAVIAPLLKGVECAFFYTTEGAKAALRDLDPLLLQTEPDRFVQLRVTCTNFSKTHYTPIGVKNNARREALDFSLLTDTKALALSHAHFRSTKIASDRLALVLGRHEGKTTGRKRPVSPPPPRLRAAYLAPGRQEVAVGPDEEEEAQPSPPTQPALPDEPEQSVVPTHGIQMLHGEQVNSLFMWRTANGYNPRTGLPWP